MIFGVSNDINIVEIKDNGDAIDYNGIKTLHFRIPTPLYIQKMIVV